MVSLTAGWVPRNFTTLSPERDQHLLRLRCVSLAVCGIEVRASFVIRVCVTSRCVKFGKRGSSDSKIAEGKIVQLWKLRRVMGRTCGSWKEQVLLNTFIIASRNGVDEQVQKSSAWTRGIWNSVRMTSELRSSSMCSWARNS
jgi:hypothetical protein